MNEIRGIGAERAHAFERAHLAGGMFDDVAVADGRDETHPLRRACASMAGGAVVIEYGLHVRRVADRRVSDIYDP